MHRPQHRPAPGRRQHGLGERAHEREDGAARDKDGAPAPELDQEACADRSHGEPGVDRADHASERAPAALGRNEVGKQRWSADRDERGERALDEAEEEDQRHRGHQTGEERGHPEGEQPELVERSFVARVGEPSGRQQKSDAPGEEQRFHKAERSRARAQVRAERWQRDGDARNHERRRKLGYRDQRDQQRAAHRLPGCIRSFDHRIRLLRKSVDQGLRKPPVFAGRLTSRPAPDSA